MMNKILKKISLTEKVINKVEKGQVKMKSKTYFILRAILFSLIAFLIFLFILFFISFIIFSLRTSGVWFMPSFGFGALGLFLISLPWLLIIVAIFLIIALELFVKKFSFAYRRPILYSVLVITILTVSGSFVIARTQIHPDFFWKAQEGKLPMAGGFYRGLGTLKSSKIHNGIVSNILEESFYLETANGEILTVIIAPDSEFSLNDIEEEDRVVILGNRDNQIIEALGVRIINCKGCQFDVFERRPMQMHWKREMK